MESELGVEIWEFGDFWGSRVESWELDSLTILGTGSWESNEKSGCGMGVGSRKNKSFGSTSLVLSA